jgi:hypothetical protein
MYALLGCCALWLHAVPFRGPAGEAELWYVSPEALFLAVQTDESGVSSSSNNVFAFRSLG